MESLIVSVVLPLLEEALGLFGGGGATASTVGVVITALEKIIPLLVNLGADIVPKIKNIIAVVSADPAATADQLAKLKDLDAASDAAFDAAEATAETDDAA